MKVSIITICYNNENDIRPTIESVVNQTYPNIEYIVVDGASKDNSLSIINEYKDKISKIISEPDKNLYDAINKGMKMATGDIVGLIHAGDKLHDNDVISDIADFFKRNNPDIIYGHSKIVDDKGKVKRVNKSPHFSRFHMRTGWMPSHQSIYVRRELFEKLGGYNLSLHPVSDYEWFIRYFIQKDIIIKKIDRFVVVFSLGGVSTSNYKGYFDETKKERIRLSWENNGLKQPLGIYYTKVLRKIPQFIISKFY